MVHGEEYPSQGTTPNWFSELHSRRQVEGHEIPLRLDAKPSNIPQDKPEAGTSGGGSVCQQADTSTASLCQLETRSNGHDHGCFYNELGRAQSICQPPMEPDREGVGTNTLTTSRACTGSSGVEDTGVVPCATGDANTHTTLDPPEEGYDSGHTPREPPRGNPTSSRVGYLRQRYKNCHISEGATKLLLASWRQKSSKMYDSLFGKWIGWCTERDSDPFSGPTVNVLARLYAQGYQYRYINSYRSAISSVHEKVDGYEVDHHPLVSRTLKGIFHERPPQPRYSETWNVGIVVTTYIESLGGNDSLSLAVLTHKSVMLLALTRPSISADLSQLDLKFRRYLPEGVAFQPTKLANNIANLNQ